MASAIAPNGRIPIASTLETHVTAIGTVISDIVVYEAALSVGPRAFHGLWIPIFVTPDGNLTVASPFVTQAITPPTPGTEIPDFLIDEGTALTARSAISPLNTARAITPNCHITVASTTDGHALALILKAAEADLGIILAADLTAIMAMSSLHDPLVAPRQNTVRASPLVADPSTGVFLVG